MSGKPSSVRSNRRYMRFSANMCQPGIEKQELPNISSSPSFCGEGSFREPLRRNLYKTVG